MRYYAVLVLMALVIASSFVPGQSRQDDWKRCTSSDPEQSIAGCSAVIQSDQEVDSSLAKAFDTRGLAYMHKREFDRAIHDYDQAIRLNPYSATAIYNRALTYRLKADYRHAISDYDQVLLLTPNDADSFYDLGLSFAREGMYDCAIHDYDHAMRMNPSMANVYQLRTVA